MKINEYNQMMKYLTRRKDPKKPDDYIYDGSKGTIRAERDIKEEEINKDPNILRRIKYYSETYDDVKLGKDFDKPNLLAIFCIVIRNCFFGFSITKDGGGCRRSDNNKLYS